MTIRSATAFDKQAVMAMLAQYRQQSPLNFQRDIALDTAGKIFDMIIAGAGVCLVAEDDEGVHGFLMAIRTNNLWSPKTWALQELAYWVNPDKRGTTSGYRLLRAYCDFAEHYKHEGRIAYYTVSKMSTSPDLKYEKFGFKLLESTWSIE